MGIVGLDSGWDLKCWLRLHTLSASNESDVLGMANQEYVGIGIKGWEGRNGAKDKQKMRNKKE